MRLYSQSISLSAMISLSILLCQFIFTIYSFFALCNINNSLFLCKLSNNPFVINSPLPLFRLLILKIFSVFGIVVCHIKSTVENVYVFL